MARGIPQTVPEHACRLPGFTATNGGYCPACEKERDSTPHPHVCGLQGFDPARHDCGQCEKERIANERKLKLYRGSVPVSSSCSGCYILVLAANERTATDQIWDEVRKTFYGVVPTEDIQVVEVKPPFTDGRILCKIVGGNEFCVG